ncbi:MAG: phage tail tip lysozyme [Patescibacteria group bacterium]
MKIRRIAAGFIAFIFTVSAVIPTFSSQVLAQSAFYNTNEIMFFDPYSCTVGEGEGTTDLVGNDNLEKILRYYVGKGLTLAQASGIAGNYQQESGFNPSAVQPSSVAPEGYMPIDGIGFGIAQWTWTSRQGPLVELSQSSNRPVTDLSLQLDYSWYEMENQKGQSMDMAEFKATTTPEDAAYIFHRDYEVSNDSEADVKAVRGGNAINIYEQFKTVIPDNASQANDVDEAICTGDGKASAYVGDDFVIYNQNDPKWAARPYGNSTIGAAGCGPAAMAMIITALTGSAVTPIETAEYGAANGTLRDDGEKGSDTDVHSVIGDRWGLKSTQLTPDVAKINKALRDGALIVVSGRGSAPFIPDGHYIVIRGVTDDGNWMIGDSNGDLGTTYSAQEWDPGSIVINMDTNNIWAMTK